MKIDIKPKVDITEINNTCNLSIQLTLTVQTHDAMMKEQLKKTIKT